MFEVALRSKTALRLTRSFSDRYHSYMARLRHSFYLIWGGYVVVVVVGEGDWGCT